MSQPVATYVELRKNRDGADRAFIVGTRVRVQDVYALAEIEGKSPDEIVQALPHLTLSQVHAALSYYFDHRDQILHEIKEDGDFARQLQAVYGPSPLQAQLKPPAA